MRRRDFLVVLGGAPAVWPLVTHAQQGDRVRRIGVLLPAAANDPRFQAWVGAFLQGLALSGWIIGSNVRVDTRWATGNAAEFRKHATELVALAPDVILAHGNTLIALLLQTSRTIPVVFPVAIDPVGTGLVDSLARPGGNATGFVSFEYGLSGKWLELLKQIAPNVTHVAVIRDAAIPAGQGQFAAIASVGPSLEIEVSPINVRNVDEIKDAISAFARVPNGGLIVTASGAALEHREQIVTFAERHKLPAVYYERLFVDAGGLISYGADYADQYRHAAGYVDRILKGEKPADLPVQVPTKYELVINLKTAKGLDLTIPPSVLARAHEVIE
jgi:putative ABC transport system substrate-binding protein